MSNKIILKSYNTLVLVCFLFLCTANVFGQSNVKRADQLYKDFDFLSALELYKKVDAKEPNNVYVNGRIGNCYRFLSKIKDAEKYYGMAANAEGSDNIFKFYYAQSLMANGKYTDALKVYNTYYEVIGKPNKKINAFQEKLFSADDKIKINLEEFNSKFTDFAPMKIRDDLYFISNRQNDVLKDRQDVWSHRPYTQIFNVDLSDTTQSKKTALLYNTEINKKYHEGPMAWDRSKNDLYLTRSNYVSKKLIVGENKVVNLKIFKVAYVPSKNDFGSTFTDNIAFDNNSYSVCYPTITADGNYMVFASDMPGGFGGLDLYVAENTGGIWSNPLNLGDNINTPGNDAFPFIMPDGFMYFASDGYLGLGGYDMYSAELQEDGTFGNVINLRSPLNSQYDDFGIWMDDNYSNGYFTSNRPSKFGDDDIYSFEKQSFMFEALIYDSKTEEVLSNAKVILQNNDTKEEFVLYSDAQGKVSHSINPFSKYNVRIEKEGYLNEATHFTSLEDEVYAEIPLVKDFGIVLEVTVIDADTKKEIPASELKLVKLSNEVAETNTANSFGKTIFILEKEVQYSIKASKKLSGDYVYLAVSNEFNTYDVESPANLNKTIELRKVNINQEIKIDNIYYDLGKYFIREDAKPELNKLVKVLNDNPGMEIELSSHTDCRGSKSSNALLSANRAEAAVTYLIKRGINYRRLMATGYGETKLTNDCACEGGQKSSCSDDQHQQNRRTVFSIMKFD